MPKRSAEEKIAHYQRKLRKLEGKQKKRRRVMTLSSSEEDENITDTIIGVQKTQTTMPIGESDEVQPSGSKEENTNVTPTEDPPEPVNPELLLALGASTSDTPDFGEPINDSLANIWLPILKRGLPKDDKNNLLKEYLIPANCKLLQAPKLNAEISAAVAEIVRSRDKKLEGFQQKLGAGTSAINRAMDLMLKTDDKIKALKSLSDGCRLLADLHFSFSNDRKKLVTPSLEKNFLHVIQDAERDETLFGNSLGEKIKASKAIEKQGHQIRKIVNQKTHISTSQTPAAHSVHQGNWTGPPRYPSNRGGRGGQRKPAAPVARRPYNTAAAQTPSKSFNHSRSRANVRP